MPIGTILPIALLVMLIAALPGWPYSRGWGFSPSGIIGAAVVVLLMLHFVGRL